MTSGFIPEMSEKEKGRPPLLPRLMHDTEADNSETDSGGRQWLRYTLGQCINSPRMTFCCHNL